MRLRHRCVLRSLLLLLLLFLLLSALPFSVTLAQRRSLANTRPIVIDTDMAIDDWWAILSLFSQSTHPIIGIIVDGDGAATCQAPHYYGARNAAKLITLINPKLRIPIVCGQVSQPQQAQYPKDFRQRSDHLLGLHLPLPAGTPIRSIRLSSDQLFTRLIHRYGAIDIVALGTATNIAHFIHTQPRLSRQIKHITYMGGAIAVEGNLFGKIFAAYPHAEWNIFVAPHAFAQLLRAPIPLTLVPLDLTNQYSASIFDARYYVPHNAQQRFIQQTLQRYYSKIQQQRVFYWDPVAAFVALHPEAIAYQKNMPLCVNTDTASHDYARLFACDSTPRTQVVFALKPGSFRHFFMAYD